MAVQICLEKGALPHGTFHAEVAVSKRMRLGSQTNKNPVAFAARLMLHLLPVFSAGEHNQ